MLTAMSEVAIPLPPADHQPGVVGRYRSRGFVSALLLPVVVYLVTRLVSVPFGA